MIRKTENKDEERRREKKVEKEEKEKKSLKQNHFVILGLFNCINIFIVTVVGKLLRKHINES